MTDLQIIGLRVYIMTPLLLLILWFLCGILAVFITGLMDRLGIEKCNDEDFIFFLFGPLGIIVLIIWILNASITALFNKLYIVSKLINIEKFLSFVQRLGSGNISQVTTKIDKKCSIPATNELPTDCKG